jgi:hypothetical protein
MIIVKTTNGDRFINEMETLQVCHLKDKATVEVWPSKWSNHQQIPQSFEIRNVESVIYTTQETKYIDEGSEIEKLKKKFDEYKEGYQKLRGTYLDIMQERDELKDRLAKIEPKSDPNRWWSDVVDRASVKEIIGHIQRRGWDHGYGVRLEKLFDNNDIKTVGDLLRITRSVFKKYRSVGGGSLSRIDDALHDLYGIDGW